MQPTINGTKARIYKVADDADKHAFRNRLDKKEESYELVREMKIQAVWYSHQELRQLEYMDRLQSSGYFILKNSHLKKLDIDPTPDGGNWGRYRFQFNINGSYSDKYLEIIETRPKSPQSGVFKLWYLYFHEVRPEHKMAVIEAPTEDSGETFIGLGNRVDIVRRN